MGLSFSRRRLDFVSYEKSLGHITQETNKLLAIRGKRRQSLNAYKHMLQGVAFVTLLPCLAWLAYLRQQVTGATVIEYLEMTVLPFLVPTVAFVLALGIAEVLWLLEWRENRTLKRLGDSKKNMIKQLKDATSFEKTMDLLNKYDTSVQTPRPRPPKGKQLPAQQTLQNKSAASGILTTALDSFGAFATKVVGDNPILLDELSRAQTAAVALKQENELLRQYLEAICAKHDEVPPFCFLAAQPTASNVTSEGPAQHSSPRGDTSRLRDTGNGADIDTLHGQRPAASMRDEVNRHASGPTAGNDSEAASPSAGPGSTSVNKRSPPLSQKRQLAKRKGVEVGAS